MELFGDLGGHSRRCTNKLRQVCPGKVQAALFNKTTLSDFYFFCRDFVASTLMLRDGGMNTTIREGMDNSLMHDGIGNT